MSASTSGSKTTTGSVTLSKAGTDTLTIVQVSGTYGTVTFVIEGSVDGTNYFPLSAVYEATGATVTGTIAPSDNATAAWKVASEGLCSVRARVTAIASGTVSFALYSLAVVGQPVLSVNQTGATVSGLTTFGAGLTFNGATGTNLLSMTDNLASALDITESSNSYLKFVTTNSGEKIVPGKDIVGAKGFNSTGPTGVGIGYATGAGGAVSQGTNRSTGVTVNTLAGAITTDTTSLAAGVEAKFTVTNSTVAATDTVVVSLASGNSGVGTCLPWVSAVAAGSFDITISNTHASTAETGACVLNFAVIKSVAS